MSKIAVFAAVLLLSGFVSTPSAGQTSARMQDKTRVETRWVTSSDGVKIVYDVRGSGATAVVFIHCWACNRQFWREQVDAVASQYRVVTLDLPGHGESGKNRAQWSVLGYADDIRAVADDLKLTRMILVGHSMGGPVSLEAAHRLSGRVVGVILADTMQSVGEPNSPETPDPVAEKLTNDFKGFFRDLSAMFSKDSDPAICHWVEEQAMASAEGPIIALRRDSRSVDGRALMRRAGVPVRAINAKPPLGADTDIEGNRKYADFEAALIENAGHFVQLERPKEFNRELMRWISQLQAQ